MKNVNRKLTLLLLIFLVTLGYLMMVTGCKKKSGAENPVQKSISNVEQQEENTGDEDDSNE